MSIFKKIKEKILTKTNTTTDKLKEGLLRTRNQFTEKVNQLVSQYRTIDEDFFEELEIILIQSDMGVKTVGDLIERLKYEVKLKNIKETKAVRELICEELIKIYDESSTLSSSLNFATEGLTIFLIVGVNGVGKTTTIGKLAYRFHNEGKKVMLAAGDTFRAGAIEQLEIWGQRVGVDVIRQNEGSDASAVIYDAIQASRARKADILICDTAGRLQNKENLMMELKKIKKVITRELPDAPHEILLVLDATTGQNALVQTKLFNEVTELSGIVLSKLDGTAKGGIVFAINSELGIPVKFVGLGEGIDDLHSFDTNQFVYGFFSDWIDEEEDANFSV